MSTVAARPMTPAEMQNLPDEGSGFELVDGELREKVLSNKSCRVGGRAYRRLDEYADRAGGGWAFPQDTPFQCFPGDTVRKPDAAYIAADRMTVEQYEDEGYCRICPDVIVEVISPNDLAAELDAKVEQWLAAGARLVWVIDPDLRLVYAHTPDTLAKLREADTLTGEPVLPGFAVPVADLFRLPGT